jgi:chromosome segregation ATPase
LIRISAPLIFASMSGSVAFDTLKFVETLEAGGFARAQAKAAAEAFAGAMSQELATKTDLSAAEGGLRSEIGKVRTELKAEIVAVRTELKTEIAETRAELKAEIAEVRTELKAEIAEVKTELKAEIAEVKTEVKAEFASVRSDMKTEASSLRSEIELAKRDLKIWFGSIMVVAVGVILAAIRYLPAGHP